MIIWYKMFANRFQSNFPHVGSSKLKLMRYVTLVIVVLYSDFKWWLGNSLQ